MEVTCESHTSAHAQIGARVACLPNHGRIGSAGSARHATARQPSAAGFLQRSIAHRSTRLPPASLGASACEDLRRSCGHDTTSTRVSERLDVRSTANRARPACACACTRATCAAATRATSRDTAGRASHMFARGLGSAFVPVQFTCSARLFVPAQFTCSCALCSGSFQRFTSLRLSGRTTFLLSLAHARD